MIVVIKKIWLLIQAYVFPIYCVGCDVEGKWVCESCFNNIDIKGYFACPICGVKNNDGLSCCKSSIKKHISITKYDEKKIIEKIIYLLKYEHVDLISLEITKIIKQFYNLDRSIFNEIDVIVPISLSKKRFKERGFNQAEVIANCLSNVIDIDVFNYLDRTKHTKQQAKLTALERVLNVKGAFTCNTNINDQTVLLVDDVYTSGATMQAGSKALYKSGAKKVVGFSLARAEMRN